MEIMPLNAHHGLLLIEDSILWQPWILDKCQHFQVIIIISKGIHFITYRKESYLKDAAKPMGDLWQHELKMIRPFVEDDKSLQKATSH